MVSGADKRSPLCGCICSFNLQHNLERLGGASAIPTAIIHSNQPWTALLVAKAYMDADDTPAGSLT